MAHILANETAWPALAVGAELCEGAGLDIIEQMVRAIEAEPAVHSVGLGSWPNMIGELELDAGMMNGRTLEAGSVCALRGYLHPISVARAVMTRLPHVLLAGTGAERFAGEIGAERAELLTDASREGYDRWLAEHIAPELRRQWPDTSLIESSYAALDPEKTGGTTCVLVKDEAGDIAVGVSTSGWAWKYPGRVGDSPIVGAGFYADNRYGAAGCIGTGEMAIRTSTARSVILYMKQGKRVQEACYEAARDYGDLSGGFLQGVIIHAIDRNGEHFVLSAGATKGSKYYVWNTDSRSFEERISAVVAITGNGSE